MQSNKSVYFPYIHNGMFSFKLLTTKHINSEHTLYCKNVFDKHVQCTYYLNLYGLI